MSQSLIAALQNPALYPHPVDGFKVIEVPIVFTERLHGHSKMSGHIVQEALIMVWRLWFQNGLRRWPRKSR